MFKISPDYFIKKMMKSDDLITFTENYFGFCEQAVNQSTHIFKNEVNRFFEDMKMMLGLAKV